MSIFKCKMCGTIEFEPGATVGVCESAEQNRPYQGWMMTGGQIFTIRPIISATTMSLINRRESMNRF